MELYVKTRIEWRKWLEKHHSTSREVWLIYYKKKSGKKRIAYDDAVEEALCFGAVTRANRIEKIIYFSEKNIKSTML